MSSSSGFFTRFPVYNPFEGEYDEARTVGGVLPRMRNPENFAHYLQELQLKTRIEDYHRRGYRNNQIPEDTLPEEIRRLILVSNIILSNIVRSEGKEWIDPFLSLQPPILQAEAVSRIITHAFENDNFLFRAFLRYYEPEDWKLLVGDNVNLNIGMQGDTELFDILIANDVQPNIEMLKGSVLRGKVDIIDHLFCVSTKHVRPLQADNDNMNSASIFVYAIDATDTEGNPSYNKNVMQRLFMYGANPNGNGKSPSPLEEAFYTSNAEAIEDLLVFGANPNIIIGRYGLSALMTCVVAGVPLSIVRLLVQYGADVNLVYEGKTALSLATGEVREYLLPLTDASLHAIVAPVRERA
jgi:hypothetical protein